VTRHEGRCLYIRHPELFSSARRLVVFTEVPDAALAAQRLMMLNMDPPQHTRQRAFVNRGFTPRMVGRLEEHIVVICHALLDEVQPDGRAGTADFREPASPAPLPPAGDLRAGRARPAEDRDRIYELSNHLRRGRRS